LANPRLRADARGRDGGANAPSTRKTQYFEIFGNRAIYHDGWMANTVRLFPAFTAARQSAIAMARDSWSRMVPSPLGPRAPGQEQARTSASA
jgi:arylsulfatase A-like enzyme